MVVAALPLPSEKLLLTVDEAAQALGIGRSTVYSLISQGLLPVTNVTSYGRRIPAAAVRQFIEERTSYRTRAGVAANG